MKPRKVLPAILLLCLVCLQQGFAQGGFATPVKDIEGKLNVRVRVQEGNERMKSVEVILYHDSEKLGRYEEVQRITSKKNGEFSFHLDLNSKYLIEINKGGYTTKKLAFNTDVFNSTTTTVPHFDLIVDMLPNRDGLGYLKPVASVFYNVAKKKFDFTTDLTKEEIK